MPSGDGTEEVSETCTVITTLLDHEAAPADAGAGHLSHQVERVGDHVRRGQDHDHRRREPHLRPRPALRLPAAGHPGSLGLADRHPAGPRQRGRRAPQRGTPPPAPCAAGTAPRSPPTRNPSPPPGTTRIRSMTSTQVTATSSLEALAAAADAAARAALHTLNVPGRQRHSRRAQKARPKFPHATAHQDDRHRETPGHRVRARLLLARRRRHRPSGRRNRPAHAGPRTVEPRAIPAATRGRQPCPHITRKQTSGHARNTRTTTPQEA